MRIWDPAAGPIGTVEAMASAPDGSWLASVGQDETIRIWNAIAPEQVAALRVDGDLMTVLISFENRVTAGGDSALYLLRMKEESGDAGSDR
jgi:WD40 repeat protein